MCERRALRLDSWDRKGSPTILSIARLLKANGQTETLSGKLIFFEFGRSGALYLVTSIDVCLGRICPVALRLIGAVILRLLP